MKQNETTTHCVTQGFSRLLERTSGPLVLIRSEVRHGGQVFVLVRNQIVPTAVRGLWSACTASSHIPKTVKKFNYCQH